MSGLPEPESMTHMAGISRVQYLFLDDDDIVIADLDPEMQASSTGRRWLKSRRPDLYGPLAKPTGIEQDTRTVRFTKAK